MNVIITIVSIGKAPPIPAAVWIANERVDGLWVEDDEVVQVGYLVVAGIVDVHGAYFVSAL